MKTSDNQGLKTARKHMVAGDGVTASAFIESCVLEPGDELIILGKHITNLGRGKAYKTNTEDTPWRYAYLLNSPADDIDPQFAKWLATNWDKVRARMADSKPNWLEAAQPLVECGDTYGLNAPRVFYGDFMEEQVAKIITALEKRGIRVSLFDECANSIEQSGKQLEVTTNSDTKYLVDAVDIAPGGPSTQPIEGDDGPFSAPTLFGHEARIAEHIIEGAEIFCVGANATMLDALRLCQSLVKDEDLKFVACSPGGIMPPPLVPRLPRHLTIPDLTEGHLTAESFLEEVGVAIEKAKARGDNMREIRAGFRAYFIDHGLHRFVPDNNEARKVPRKLGYWLRGGTRDTILDFHRLMKLGKTQMLTGAVTEIDSSAGAARVHIRDGAGNVTIQETGFVINCAGAGANSTYDPLTQQMIERGWIGICPISGGLEVSDGCTTGLKNVRHLSPATTVVGREIMPMPLYDAHLLRTWAKRANGR